MTQTKTKKRRHRPRKPGHVHRRKFGEIRQAKCVQKWRGFTLQKGMYYGEDEEGFWATYGVVYERKSAWGLVMYRAKRVETQDWYVPHKGVRMDADEPLEWKRVIDDGETAKKVHTRINTMHDVIKMDEKEVLAKSNEIDNSMLKPDKNVKRKGGGMSAATHHTHEDERLIPAALRKAKAKCTERKKEERAKEDKYRRILYQTTMLPAVLCPENRELRRADEPYYAYYERHIEEGKNGRKMEVSVGLYVEPVGLNAEFQTMVTSIEPVRAH